MATYRNGSPRDIAKLIKWLREFTACVAECDQSAAVWSDIVLFHVEKLMDDDTLTSWSVQTGHPDMIFLIDFLERRKRRMGSRTKSPARAGHAKALPRAKLHAQSVKAIIHYINAQDIGILEWHKECKW